MVIEDIRPECCWQVTKVALFVEGDKPNSIVMYNFWREHRLIVVDANGSRHFRLEPINREQLLALNDT